MAQCPNCSRQTLRTKDWACQWCGYPLLSGSYKEILKTYRQLKEEGLRQPEVVPEPEPEPRIEPEIKPSVEPEEEPPPEPEKEAEPVAETEPEPEAPAIILTVDEIFKEYTEDESAADARFVNKLLQVTGMVTMIDVKDILDIHCIRISGAEGNNTQSVKCMFDKKHAPLLKELQKGQTVTVRGVFDGSLIAIRMVNCALVT